MSSVEIGPERTATTASLIDVLDRVLDKGIVIDAWVRVSLVGIDILTVQARVVVASISTYLGYAPVFGAMDTVAAPAFPELRLPDLATPRDGVSRNGSRPRVGL